MNCTKKIKQFEQRVELSLYKAELNNNNRNFGEEFQVNLRHDLVTLTWDKEPLNVLEGEEYKEEMINDISFSVGPSQDLLGVLGLASFLGVEARQEFFKGLEEVYPCLRLPKLFSRDLELKQLCAFCRLVPDRPVVLFMNVNPRRVFLIRGMELKMIKGMEYDHDDDDTCYIMYSDMGLCELKRI